jgi:hypothetical protein
MRVKAKQQLFKFSKIFLLTMLAAPSAHARQTITYQSPITVNASYIAANGSVITGNYQGTTTQAAITIATTSPVTIINSNLSGPGNLIQATAGGANITVKNTQGYGTNPNVKGAVKGIFLYVSSFANINMTNNNITGVRIGFYNSSYVGNKTASNTLIIDNNVFLNMDARPSNGNNGYISSGQYNVQAIHTGNIYGLPNVDIGWNEIMNTAGQSASGALIELNETSGTSSSPISVHNNYISGAFPTLPGSDLYAFGGIAVNGASNDTATTASSFINIANNNVVATANYGIAIQAGHDVTVTGNRVVSSGYLPNGTTFYPMSTYGDAAGAVNVNVYNQPTTVFFNNNVTNNVLGLVKNNGSNAPVRNDWNLPGQGNAVNGNTSYTPNDSADPTVYDETMEFSNWMQAARLATQTIGTATTGYQPDLQALTAMGPINTSTNSTLVLDHVSVTNPSGDCINAGGGSQITITNSVIGPCGGRGIHVASTASTLIQNNYIHDVTSQGISVEFATSQSVQHNTIQNSGFGIYIANNNSNVTSSNIDYNQITNVTGITNQNVSAIQFNQVSGPNNSISCNVYSQPGIPAPGMQGTCDSFSLFLSSGTASSPIKVTGNRINGSGDFWNCGGIMLTDGDTGSGTTGPGYVYAGYNYLLNAGNYGIDVSTGHDVTIDQNFVYADLYDFYNTSNNTYGPGRIGINTFNVYSSSCTNMTVTNNTVFFLSSLTGNNTVANYGLSSQCAPTTQSNNTSWAQLQPFQFPSFYTPRPNC